MDEGGYAYRVPKVNGTLTTGRQASDASGSNGLTIYGTSYGAILAKLGRGRGLLPPFVSMMPVVPNGSPRFVEQSHGQGAGWLGPIYNPMRIDADASRPGYGYDSRNNFSRVHSW